MPRSIRNSNNSNEKSIRNKQIYMDRTNGDLVVELSQKYNLSIPRIHRICMQEENKELKIENQKLKSAYQSCLLNKPKV